MLDKAVTTLMASAIAVAAVGTGVAIGASTQKGVHACASTSTRRLGLIKNGKCAAGFKKVTLGATGPRGPQGPGAIEQELTVPGEDIQHTFTKNVAGIVVNTNCTAAGNPSIDLEPAVTGQKLDLSGTASHDTLINVVSQFEVSDFTLSGTSNLGLDVIARAGTAPLQELRISGIKNGTTCQMWDLSVPTKAVN